MKGFRKIKLSTPIFSFLNALQRCILKAENVQSNSIVGNLLMYNIMEILMVLVFNRVSTVPQYKSYFGPLQAALKFQLG